MKSDLWILAIPLLLIGLLFAVLFWSSQDFADRCERAGGVNIDYEVCIPKGTQILMTGLRSKLENFSSATLVERSS